MTTKSNRHAMIETTCQWEKCGIKFMARKQRVDRGQSRFCSREHHREWLKAQGSQRKNIGKENAIIVWENTKGMYVAYWYDENMKYRSEPWGRWAWELNFGEVPNGYRVSYKDGDSSNAITENLFLKHTSEFTEVGDKSRGVPKSEETKRKLSEAHTGKVLSEEHKINIGKASRERWNSGLFDSVHVGENNPRWRGGVNNGYPREFVHIKDFIKERDNYTCQICQKSVYRSRHGHVHHIDGDRAHNDESNLILVCSKCHILIHSTCKASPVILAFRAMLYWNKEEIENG